MTPAQSIALWADELRDISAWLPEHELPDEELLATKGQRIRDAYRVWRGDRCAYFER